MFQKVLNGFVELALMPWDADDSTIAQLILYKVLGVYESFEMDKWS